MTLKVSSWNKTCDTEWIPSWQANDIWNDVVIEKNRKLVFDDGLDLGLCWEYFDRAYKCYCLEPKYNGTREDYIFNLNKFQFSFRELDNSTEENRIFTMKKDKECSFHFNKLDLAEENRLFILKKDKECSVHFNKLDYVSDIHGFALLKLGFNEIRVHYYDSERLFSISMKIQISNNAIGEIKLCCGSIWITNAMYYGSCLIDMISIKNEKEWYHVRTNTCDTIFLSRVFSSTMLVADDGSHETGSCLLFSLCKALLIDHDNLVPYEKNNRNFIDFDKPKVCETDSLVVCGIFKSTIILSELVDIEVWYFLSYNEKMKISFFKRIDFTIFMKGEKDLYYNDNSFKIIPLIGKMFLKTMSSSILVFDMGTFEVTQVLECTMPYSPIDIFKWSKQDKMLNVVCMNCCYPHQICYLKHALYGGKNLKELALNVVVEHFSLKKIQTSNIRHSLFREIMTRKMY